MKITKQIVLSLVLYGCGHHSGKAASSATAPSTPSTSSKTSTSTTTTGAPVDLLSLDLTDAIGLATTSSNPSKKTRDSGSSSNFSKVLSDSSLQPAIVTADSSSPPDVSSFYVSPNQDIYLVFSSGVNFWVGSETPDAHTQCTSPTSTNCTISCVFGKADHTTGKMSCVDPSLQGVDLSLAKPVQFDSKGRVYYYGASTGTANMIIGADMGSQPTIHMLDTDGTITDVTDAAQKANGLLLVNNFVVEPSGTVYYVADADSSLTSPSFLNSYDADTGTTSTQYSQPNSSLYVPTWAEAMPNGNIYFGVQCGAQKLDPATGTITDTAWPTDSVTHPVSLCGQNSQDNIPTNNYGNALYFYETQDKSTVYGYGTSGNGTQGVIEYYPNPTTAGIFPLTISTYVSQFIGIPATSDDKLVLVGSNAINDVNPGTEFFLELYDPANGTETNLLPNDNIQVNNLSYSAGKNAVFFSGTRVGDNSSVVGFVDLSNSAVTINAVDDTVSSFQSL